MTSRAVFIALGANLPSREGEPSATIKAALQILSAAGVQIERCSRLYRTPAWPDPSHPSFINAAARVFSPFGPAKLMELLHETETAFGRSRSARNAPRTLDLDLLDFEGRVEAGPPTLPHPRMQSRGFVLIPLADVAPDWRHPLSGASIRSLIAALPQSDRESVREF